MGRRDHREDRDMLESTDPHAIVDMGRKIEKHMPSDQAGRTELVSSEKVVEGS